MENNVNMVKEKTNFEQIYFFYTSFYKDTALNDFTLYLILCWPSLFCVFSDLEYTLSISTPNNFTCRSFLKKKS